MREKLSALVALLALTFLFLTIQSCKPEKEKPVPKQDRTISGSITSTDGTPIRGAKVFINGNEIKTNDDGSFSAQGDSAGRFVVTIKKRGYGLLSKVFLNPVKNYPYQLTPGYVTRIDPKRSNTIRDLLSSSRCSGSGLQNIKFDSAYKKIPFVYDSQGKLIDFGWPSSMADLYAFATSPACNPGAQVTFPANSIVNASNQPVTDSVTVSITTVDLQSQDGMPGDYTYQDANGTGTMTSAGAVSIEVYSDADESFNLKKEGSDKVILSLPVDPAILKFNKKLTETIPVFNYNEKSGIWEHEREQTAKLNLKSRTYEVTLEHLSAINMDYKMPNPTCFRFRQDPLSSTPVNTFRLAMLSPTYGYKLSTTAVVGDETGTDCFLRNGTNLHLVYNAPAPGEFVAAILTENNATPTAFFGITVQQTPATSYAGTGYTTTCPCTSATIATSPAPDDCYDAGSSACDETRTDCKPFSNTCENLQIRLFPQDVILAGRLNGSNLEPKWIFKSLADGTTYNYTIRQYHYDAGAMTDVEDLPAQNGGPLTYATANPIQSIAPFAKNGAATKMIITISPTSLPDIVSNEVPF